MGMMIVLGPMGLKILGGNIYRACCSRKGGTSSLKIVLNLCDLFEIDRGLPSVVNVLQLLSPPWQNATAGTASGSRNLM